MKRFYLYFCILFLSACAINAQSIDRISGRCPAPNRAVYGSATVQQNGDINLIPCPNRFVLVNGNAIGGGASVATTTNTGTIPYFSSETALSKSAVTYSPTTFNGFTPAFGWQFNATALNYRIGDITNELALLFIDADLGMARLGASTTTSLGDTGGLNNGVQLTIDSENSAFTFSANNPIALMDLTGVNNFTYFRNVAGGTGNVSSNAPVGTVNFAAGTGITGITVTNANVTTTSLINAIAQTNDSTCSVKNVVAANGSFVIRMDANCAAQTRVGYWVTN